MSSGFRVQAGNGTVRFAVHVQPRASSTEIVGTHGDALKVRLSAPPVDDAANEALIELLAREIGVKRGAVRIVSGGTSRHKVIEVTTSDTAAIERLAER